METKKKRQGHYCRICGEYKANEKFSGRGHASHICKACHSLPVVRRNELEKINKIDRIQENFFISKENLNRLKSYAGDKRYPEASQYAQDALDGFYRRMDEYHGNIPKEPTVPVVFSELDDKLKKEVYERLDELICEFLSYSDFLPDKEDTNEILAALCEEISGSLNCYEPEPYDPSELYEDGFQFDRDKSFDENIQDFHAHVLEQEPSEDFDEYAEAEPGSEEPKKELVINNDLQSVWDEILNKVLAEFKADGVEFISFLDSLNVAVTERLIIRRFIKSDLPNLHRIMKKPEVMYAWEHRFHKHHVKTWINRQIERYKKDGYGYFAVTLKDTGKLIGQAGLIKTDINGQNVTELGCIFDNAVWGQGYCTEAARACIKMAFGELGIDKLYCTVRPENEPSIKVAERLGMVQTGEYIKVYEGKEMPHLIYVLYKQ